LIEIVKNIEFSLLIVIPCYNEFNRLSVKTIIAFLKENQDVGIVFSNDGSTDNSTALFDEIKKKFSKRVFINTLTINRGKAAAVRSGFLFSLEHLNFDRIAYLDADLSTSLDECLLLSKDLNDQILFVFGSRISKIDNLIDRRFLRFIIGRIIATMISKQLDLSVYDTQCGCKIFRKDLADHLFKERFFSKWLFDVEIFHRLIQLIGKNSIKYTVKEVPLESWVDTKNSKVKMTYFFRLWFDLLIISKKYKKKEKVIWKPLPQNTF